MPQASPFHVSSSGYANPAFQPELGYNDVQGNGYAPPVIAKAAPVDSQSGQPATLTEVEIEQQAKRDRNPLFYCKIITAYPKTAFGRLKKNCRFF